MSSDGVPKNQNGGASEKYTQGVFDTEIGLSNRPTEATSSVPSLPSSSAAGPETSCRYGHGRSLGRRPPTDPRRRTGGRAPALGHDRPFGARAADPGLARQCSMVISVPVHGPRATTTDATDGTVLENDGFRDGKISTDDLDRVRALWSTVWSLSYTLRKRNQNPSPNKTSVLVGVNGISLEIRVEEPNETTLSGFGSLPFV